MGPQIELDAGDGAVFRRWLSYYTAGLGFLMQPFNKEGQALHDRLTGTVVLRRKASAQVDMHELRYASFGRRAAAQLFDWVLCLCVYAIPFVILTLFMPSSAYVNPIVFLLIAFSYHVTCWTSMRQATFGMMLAGVCITDRQRHRLSKKQATARFFLRWLSYATAGIGFHINPSTRNA